MTKASEPTKTSIYDNPEYKALLAGIIKFPQDDLRRLVTADWLEEHGQAERAEFIRIQIDLAANPKPHNPYCATSESPSHWCDECAWREKYFYVERREQELWADHGREWFGYSALWLTSDKPNEPRMDDGFVVSRGFVSGWRGPIVQWRGVECVNCQGVGWADQDRGGRLDNLDCPQCHGTGGARGCGPLLVREHPIEVVKLTGMSPHITDNDDVGMGVAGVWVMEDGSPRPMDGRIPADLWLRLKGGTVISPGWMAYGSDVECDDALSDAALRWAKEQSP